MGHDALRLPDFVIVGAMKSATTSLYRWLDEQPDVFVAASKETRFFTDHWDRGREWYGSQFADAGPGQLLGESSVNYTNPALAPVAAERMADEIPDATVIYVIRHPVERIRSHYRHEVQRRREARPLLDALREHDNPYLGHSMYERCFRPYIERFPRERLVVVRFEDLVRAPSPAWTTVLASLGLQMRPAPETTLNASGSKAQWRSGMAWAKRHRLISLRQVSKLPRPVRRVGRRLFAQEGPAYDAKLAASRVPIPRDLVAPVWDDLERLEAWLGSSLWEPTDEATASNPRQGARP